jgi:hypothetical protein
MTATNERAVRVLRALATFALLASGGAALASSHREAPAISNDPAADNTDVFAWVSPGHDKLFLIANWIPFEEPSGGPNFHRFSDDVRYEIHLARGDSLDDAIVYRFEFHTPHVKGVSPSDLKAPPGGGKEFFAQLTGVFGQTYDVTRIVNGGEQRVASRVPVAPPRIGPRTQKVGNQLGLPPYSSPEYNDTYAASFITATEGGGRVWAGPRDDPFYVDLGGIFDLANLRPKGTAQDGLAGYNVHSIALEIPVERLTADGQKPGSTPSDGTTLGVWAASYRRKVTTLTEDEDDSGGREGSGDWVQVSRLGLPLVNEVIIGYQDKDKYNRTQPKDDVANFAGYFLNPVLVRDAEAVGIYQALGVDPTPFKTDRTDILQVISLTDIPTKGAHHFPASAIGDVLRVDLATDSAFPNGRPIAAGTNHEQADVTDVLLSLVLSKGMLTISDGVDHNDKTFLSEFPFLALPWEGFGEGHGKVPAP